MHFKLAILTALARRPDGRATLGEVRREVEVLSANQDQAPATEDLSALRDIDIFQSGLVVADGRGLQITDAGRSLLDALETFSEPSIPPVSSSSSKSLELIDDLIGTGRRPKLIDLERGSSMSKQTSNPFNNRRATALTTLKPLRLIRELLPTAIRKLTRRAPLTGQIRIKLCPRTVN